MNNCLNFVSDHLSPNQQIHSLSLATATAIHTLKVVFLEEEPGAKEKIVLTLFKSRRNICENGGYAPKYFFTNSLSTLSQILSAPLRVVGRPGERTEGEKGGEAVMSK